MGTRKTLSKTERGAQVALIALGAIAVLVAMKLAEDVLAPITLALVAGVILSPVNDRLGAIGLPHSVSTLISFFAGIFAIFAVVLVLQPVAMRAVDAFPRIYAELNSALYVIQAEVRGLETVEEGVRDLVDPGGDADPTDRRSEGESAADAIPTVEDVVFMAPAIAAQIVIFMGTLFFFLLTRRDVYAALATRLTRPDRRSEFAMRLAAAERHVARYFLTISLINAGLGATVATVMLGVGMPSPLIWGIVAFLANFLLYVGPATLFLALGIAGVVVFDGAYCVVPALSYLFLNMIESQFVTPTLLGRRLSVNPLLIFLALTFFLWLWGPIGAIVAIPLLLWAIVLTTDVKALRDTEDDTVNVEPAAEIVG